MVFATALETFKVLEGNDVFLCLFELVLTYGLGLLPNRATFCILPLPCYNTTDWLKLSLRISNDWDYRCHRCRSTASQTGSRVTCLVSVQAMEELGHFQLSRIVYRSLRNGAIMLKHNDGGG